jgi:hypothetical protein
MDVHGGCRGIRSFPCVCNGSRATLAPGCHGASARWHCARMSMHAAMRAVVACVLMADVRLMRGVSVGRRAAARLNVLGGARAPRTGNRWSGCDVAAAAGARPAPRGPLATAENGAAPSATLTLHAAHFLLPRAQIDFMMGGVAAAVSKTAAAPIERVKLLIQNQVRDGRCTTRALCRRPRPASSFHSYRGAGHCRRSRVTHERRPRWLGGD